MARRGAVLSLQLPLLWLCFSFATGSLNMKPGSLNINSNFASVREQASKIQSDIIDWRRYLHMKPEMMYQEYETSEYIQKVLKSMGISFTLGWANNTRYGRIPGVGGTGVVADIGSGRPPIVALRADMDGLPIEEDTPVRFRSRLKGRMHACGHDGHTSMLLGAAKLLKEAANELSEFGTVRLIFQPAEEGGAGAKRMREEGVLKGVSRIFGLHLWPALPSGSIGGRPGVTMAAADFFEFDILGKGGHGAMPHLGIDPVVAAAAIVQSLQSLVSRETDPRDSAVLSITKLHAGHAFNVIPAQATLGGTIRAMSEVALGGLRSRLVDVAKSVASAHRCSLDRLQFQPDPYPPTVNDPALWQWLGSPEVGIYSAQGAKDQVPMQWDMEPTLGGEDFSFFAQDVPGAFVFLGQGSSRLEVNGFGIPPKTDFLTNTSLHSSRFTMDESVLALGTALHAHFALRSLSALQGKPEL